MGGSVTSASMGYAIIGCSRVGRAARAYNPADAVIASKMSQKMIEYRIPRCATSGDFAA